MSSQGNVEITGYYDQGACVLRFGHDAGPAMIVDMVWMPVLHARFIRHTRRQSVEGLKEHLEMGLPYSSMLHFMDRWGSLFGTNTEYFAQVLLYCHLFDAFPLTSGDEDAWGADEIPVMTVHYGRGEVVTYSIGNNGNYPYGESQELREELKQEVAEFNERVIARLPKELAEKAKVQTDGQSFSMNHNLITLAILLNDLDITLVEELSEEERDGLSY